MSKTTRKYQREEQALSKNHGERIRFLKRKIEEEEKHEPTT